MSKSMDKLNCIVSKFLASFAILASVLLFLHGSSALAANEEINDYQSEIIVNKDGSLNVTETIRVTATGDKIKRGIYRDFPTRYQKSAFLAIEVPFKILSVTRDGKKEPYHTEKQDNGIRIYIGRKNVRLTPGQYTYQMSYWTNFQLGYFDDHDELYWNVTGNGWIFPIARASATVRLPTAVPFDKVTSETYTGKQGAKDDNARSAVDQQTKRVQFETTAPLRAHEGLTIVVSFPKGFVREPTEAEKSELYFFANLPLWVAAVGFLSLLAYYLVAWFLVGRDPPGRAIMPLFDPPEDLSPACARYLWKMGYDRTCFTAAILNLACKGYLTIQEQDGVYTLGRTNSTPKEKASTGEITIYNKLLADGWIVLKQTNYKKVKSAIEALSTKLSAEFDGKLFYKHRLWLIPGWVLTALVLAGIWFSGDEEQAFAGPFLSVWLTIWTFVCYGLAKKTMRAWRSAIALRRSTVKAIGSYFGALVTTLFCIPFFLGELVGLGFLIFSTSVWMAVPLIGLFGINWIFWRLIKQPTAKGRGVMDAIEGFRMYLGPVEGEMLEKMNPPEKTPQLFEKLLPYALALGVENTWAERFVEVLRAASTDPASSTYQPAWYVGSAWNAAGIGSFASNFSSSLGSAIASSSTAPGSSSGSSGGGFSGGGGGGGGGGGW